MIPITFNKDDLNNVKKGNVRGQDLASFLSISMPKRAGVLDIFDDPCGYVQITPTTGYATVTMKKGYVNIFGRCIYVEQGEQVQIALPDSGSITGTFGIRIDLGESGANEVTWFTKTTTLQQDNILNNEISGVYEFALYNYTATSSSLELSKIAPIIQNIDDYLKDYLKGANFDTQPETDNSKKIATTEFVQNVLNTVKSAGSKTQNGDIRLDNGLIIKWGVASVNWSYNSYGRTTISFAGDNIFSQVFNVIVTPIIYASDTASLDVLAKISEYNTTGFNVYTKNTRQISYVAIGV